MATNANKTTLAYKKLIKAFKSVDYKCVAHEDFLVIKPMIIFFDKEREKVFIAVNLGGDYKDEFLQLVMMLQSTKLKLDFLGFYVYDKKGEIIWDYENSFIKRVEQSIDESENIDIDVDSSFTSISVVSRNKGITVSRPDSSVIRPIYG